MRHLALASTFLLATSLGVSAAEHPVRITLPERAPAVAPDVKVVPAPIAERAENEREALVGDKGAWLGHLAAKREARIARSSEIGGLGMIGARLGTRADAAPANLPPEVLASLEGVPDDGAIVIWVSPDSPAEAAGLEPGDVIVRFANLWIDSMPMAIRMISRAQPGDEYELWFVRAGEIERTWVTPADRRDLEPKTR